MRTSDYDYLLPPEHIAQRPASPRDASRLMLLPPHDPQFRRNRERVARDAERELLSLEWDLGYPEDE